MRRSSGFSEKDEDACIGIADKVKDHYNDYFHCLELFIKENPVFVNDGVVSELNKAFRTFRKRSKSLWFNGPRIAKPISKKRTASRLYKKKRELAKFQEKHMKKVMTSPDSLLLYLESNDRIWKKEHFPDRLFDFILGYIFDRRKEWIKNNGGNAETSGVDEKIAGSAIYKAVKTPSQCKILTYDRHISDEVEGFGLDIRNDMVSEAMKRNGLTGFYRQFKKARFGTYRMGFSGRIYKSAHSMGISNDFK